MIEMISRTDRVKYEDVLDGMKEDWGILHAVV